MVEHRVRYSKRIGRGHTSLKVILGYTENVQWGMQKMLRRGPFFGGSLLNPRTALVYFITSSATQAPDAFSTPDVVSPD